MNDTLTAPPLVSDQALYWARITMLGVAGQLLVLLGVTTNVVNIVVFVKLGLKDPMNISLLGLSVSDFFSCFTMLWTNLCLFPPFMELDLPFVPNGMEFLFSSGPHAAFVKVTVLITAFITLERCLCVTFPLKIKELITAKRVTVIIVFLYVVSFAFLAPIYLVYYHGWVFFEQRNKTLYTLLFRDNLDEVQSVVSIAHGPIITFSAFFSTIAFTALLVYKLKKNARWRQKATGASAVSSVRKPTPSDPSQATSSSSSSSSSSSAPQSQTMSPRDAKVTKMVVMISSLYMICFCPVGALGLAMFVVPEIKIGGVHEDVLHFVIYITYLFELTNASLNFFIYLNMSSNYQTMFRKIFRIKKENG